MIFCIEVLEQIAQGNIISGLIMLVVLLLVTILILKWISKYTVSFFGMFFVNGMLTLISFIILVYIIIFITGSRTFSQTAGYFILFIGMLPIIFWWNFNTLEIFQKNRKGGFEK